MSTGQIIKDLRKEKRITQTDLAHGVHVTQQTVTAWESGRAIPNANTLDAIANFFNVSADYLLGRSKVKNPQSRDLDDAIDGAMSFEGRPVTDHDRRMMKQLWKAYIENKD